MEMLEKYRVIGPCEVEVNGKIVTVEDLLAKLDIRAEVVEAKISLQAQDATEKETEDYLAKFSEYKVRKIEFGWYAPIASSNFELMSGVDVKLEVRASISAWKLREKYLDKTLKDVLRELTLVKLGKQTLFDQVTEMLLTNAEEKEAITFGCGASDCKLTLHHCSDEAEYQRFVDHFEGCGRKVKAFLCLVTKQPETTYKSIPTGKMVEDRRCYI